MEEEHIALKDEMRLAKEEIPSALRIGAARNEARGKGARCGRPFICSPQ